MGGVSDWKQVGGKRKGLGEGRVSWVEMHRGRSY